MEESGSVQIITDSDPEPGGPKTYGSESGTLPALWIPILFSPSFYRYPFFFLMKKKKRKKKFFLKAL
jgi:hypothetical protein